MFTSKTSPENFLYTSSALTPKKKSKPLRNFIQHALSEDIGDGDHTTLATIPSRTRCTVKLFVKKQGIIAGVRLAKIIFSRVDRRIKLRIIKRDGSAVKKGDIVFTADGTARPLLTAERLVLNVMQRMSGIATATNRLVRMVKKTGVKITDTRKTVPGMRILDKEAVQLGGGVNHRMGLYDMILIKDNHVDIAGGPAAAFHAAEKYLEKKKKKLKIEIEVRNLRELRDILENGRPGRILFDNFSPPLLKKAVRMVNRRCETEASGGINEKNILHYARTGVDFIAVGALTHSVKCLDLSMKVIRKNNLL